MAGESLRVVAGNAAGSSIALDQELVVGRSTPGLGSLGGDSEISRVHARIYHDASGQLIAEDLGSTNGTFVNGNRISAATPLRPGDQVRVGQTTMTVEGGATEGATTVGQVVPAPVPAAAAPPPPVAQTPPTQQFPPAAPGPPPGQYGGQQPGFAGGPIGGPPQRATGGSKAPWIALAAVVLIALIVGGLAIGGVFSSDKKKNVVSTTTTPAATTPATPPPPTTPPPATTTPTSSPPAMQGPAGTMGPPPTGRYDTHNPTVLKHIEAALKLFLASKGIPNAQVSCAAVNAARAVCHVVNPANGKSINLAVKVNQTTGKLTLV